MLPNPYLHVIGADPRRIIHAIRFDNANWTRAGDVEAEAGNPGFVASVAAASDGATLHVFVAAGSIFHAIRNPDGSWKPFKNIAKESGEGWLGANQVAAAVVNREIHLCGVSREGRLIHAVFANGVWTPPADVIEQARGPVSTFLHVACTAHEGELFVAGAPLGFPAILYTTRHADGTWDLMTALIELQPSPTGQMLRVACASVLQDIHVVSAEVDGRLRHITRDHNTNTWSDFVDVKGITGNPGRVAGVAAASCANELHVVLTTSASNNWRHSIRRANGSWQPFGDIWGATNSADGAGFSAVACVGLEPPEGAEAVATVPALAFQISPCLPAATESSASAALAAALQRLGSTRAIVAGLVGGAQVDLACVNDTERGGVFIYSESQQAQDLSVPSIDLFSRTKQGDFGDFSILFGTGAIVAALGAAWDTMRGDDGRVRLPSNSDVELFSYTVDFPDNQIRLRVDGQARVPGGMSVDFSARYTDSLPVVAITVGPDGDPNTPHFVLGAVDSPSLDISPVFYAIAVFLIPGILNAVIGGLAVSYPAPSLSGNLSSGLGGVIAQVFLPKLYIPGGQKLLFQYEGVKTGADFGVQAFGSVSQRVRTAVLTVTSQFGFGRITKMRPIGGGGDGGGGGPPPSPPTKCMVFATTDDMRNPRFSFAGGGLSLASVTTPQQSSDGTQFTTIATFRRPRKTTTATVVVTATDADGLTVSESKTIHWVVDIPD